MALRRLTRLRSALKPMVGREMPWTCERSSVPRLLQGVLQQEAHLWIRSFASTTSFPTNLPLFSSTLYAHSVMHPWLLISRPFSTEFSSGGDKKNAQQSAGKKSLMIEEEEYESITDKIPEKPMTAAEGISYTFIILAAFAVLAMCLWAFIVNYVWDPIEYTCFNITLEKLRSDPRVTVRVGDVIKGYGTDSMNRRQRHVIRNRKYRDANGTDHTQIQFNIRGSGGVGIVYADMFQDASKQWQYTYLYVDIPEQGKNASQRLAIVTPPLHNVPSSL